MIVSKRKPKIESSPIDWARAYDQHFQNALSEGRDEADAENRAYALCCKSYIEQNPWDSKYLPMGNKGVCCFCGEKGADMPLSILGAGVMAHSGLGRAGKFELVPVAKTTNWEPNCWDAMVLHLFQNTEIGLAIEGLRLNAETTPKLRAAE